MAAVTEMAIGATGLATTGVTGVGAVVSVATIVHGADTASAGLHQLVTGEVTPSISVTMLTQLTGSQQTAHLIDGGISIGLTFGTNMAIEGAILSRGAALEGAGATAGVRGMASQGVRNTEPLTQAGRAEVVDAVRSLGINPADIEFFSGTQGSIYSDMLDKVVVGPNIFPAGEAVQGQTVLSRLGVRPALAHEVGHMMTTRAGVAFDAGSVLDEFQACIAARDLPGLTSVERYQLLRHAVELARDAGISSRQLVQELKW